MLCKNCGESANEDDFGCCEVCSGETCPSCRVDEFDAHLACAEEDFED